VRHGIGTAISQRSTRYVDEAQSDWILHPLLDEALFHPDEELLGTVESAMASCQFAYGLIVERLMEVMVAKGVDKLTARKQARGAARGILGNALETEMVWSANIRALRHVIEMRAADGADAEIRLLANRLLAEARQVVPEYFSDYEEQPASDGFGFSVITPYRKI
jgi:thymidylate synthase (FAD)